MFRFAKTHPAATLPSRGRPGDAGFDLFACEDATLEPGTRRLVDCGVAIEIPADCYGRVAPRSGLAVKHGIQVGAGVVDATYRGSIRALLFNHGDAPFSIRAGDRIAQLVFEMIYTPIKIEEVPYEALSDTVRGDGGFGSSGTR
jgi:dUTP pyrophosphatase